MKGQQDGGRKRNAEMNALSSNVSRLESIGEINRIDKRSTSSVDDPSSLLEVAESFLVNDTTSTFVKRAVKSEDVELTKELFEVFDPTSVDSLFGCSGERLVVVCMFRGKTSVSIELNQNVSASVDVQYRSSLGSKAPRR